jgi:uncharacterized protein involved in type VI secretion and phage assembly
MLSPSSRGPVPLYGKYRGIVAGNAEGLGRLMVKVPSVFGPDHEGVLAEPCVPYAGPNVGLHFLPPELAGVWVEFAGGDVRFPIWTGCYWREGDIEEADDAPNVKFLRTEKFALRIDDDASEITIENLDGSMLTLTAIEGTLESATVTAKASNGRKVTLAATSVSINDGNLEVT